MTGIFPSSGTSAATSVNGVDVPTTCPTGELFYPFSRCFPRFDPASANAIISEILNAVDSAGLVYDCDRLDNLSLALTSGQVVAAIAVAAGVDSFVQPILVGDTVLTLNNGDTVVVSSMPTVSTVAAAGVDSFGNVVAAGDQVLSLPNGDVLVIRAGATIALATAVGVDSFGNPIDIGDEVTTFANGDTLVGDLGAGVQTAVAAGVDSFGNVILIGDDVMTLTNSQTINLNGGHAAVIAAVAAGVDSFGQPILIGDPVLTLSDGTTVNLSSTATPTSTGTVAGTVEIGTSLEIVAGTALGGSGAPLVLNPSTMRTATITPWAIGASDSIWTREFGGGNQMGWQVLSDVLSLSASPNATNILSGTLELATSAEVAAGASTGGTGAALAMVPGRMAGVGVGGFPFGVGADLVWTRDAGANTMSWQLVDDTLPQAANAARGVVEMASPAEIVSATAVGVTGAELAMSPADMFAASDQVAAVDPLTDGVWCKDASSGQMRWLGIDDLPDTNVSANVLTFTGGNTLRSTVTEDGVDWIADLVMPVESACATPTFFLGVNAAGDLVRFPPEALQFHNSRGAQGADTVPPPVSPVTGGGLTIHNTLTGFTITNNDPCHAAVADITIRSVYNGNLFGDGDIIHQTLASFNGGAFNPAVIIRRQFNGSNPVTVQRLAPVGDTTVINRSVPAGGTLTLDLRVQTVVLTPFGAGSTVEAQAAVTVILQSSL